MPMFLLMNRKTQKYLSHIKIISWVSVLLILLSNSCARPTLVMPASVKLREVQVTCEHNRAPKKVYLPCEAVGLYSDGSVQTLTSEAHWSISDPAIMETPHTLHRNWVRGLSVGSTDIQATIGSVTGTFRVEVTPATPVSVAVTPSNQVFHLGITKPFTSTCVFSDNSIFDVTESTTWTSQDPAIAATETADDVAVVKALSVGKTAVEAEFDGVTGSTPVTILEKMLLSIYINPSNIAVAQGLPTTLTATGIYTDLTTVDLTELVIWSTVDGGVATVSNSIGQQGRMTAVQSGTTKVQATFADFAALADITVTGPSLSSVTLSPPNPSLANGLSQQITATGHYSDGSTADISELTTWTTSDPTVATASNVAGQKGKITGVGLGTATITVTIGAVTQTVNITITAATLQSIEISPSPLSIPLGLSETMSATGIYSDGSTQDLSATVTWWSSDPSVADVSNLPGTQGRVTSLMLGNVTISATIGSVVMQITISVGLPVLQSIDVTPTSNSIAKGTHLQYTAMGNYSDGSSANITSLVTWGSTNPSAATISNMPGTVGRATGAGVGNTNITATLGSVSGQTFLDVTPATLLSITVTPANSTIVILIETKHMVATGTYSDGSTVDITSSVFWTSTNPLTVQISNDPGCEGQASGLGLGTTTIRATGPGGVFGTTQLNGIL